MFSSVEVLIGLALVYLLLALVVTALTEWSSSLFRLRSRNLRKAIRQMLDGAVEGANTSRFFDHPRIIALSEGRRLPSYIPSKAFAEVVTDLVKPATDGSTPAAAAIPILTGKGVTLEGVEERFLDTMNRASGWYKRTAIALSIVWSIVVVVAANADTLEIAHRLWESPSLRQVVVAQAERRVAMGRPRPLVDATYENPGEPVPNEEEQSAEDVVDPNNLTVEDRAVLESLVGWQSDLRRINGEHCRLLQLQRDNTCAGDNAAACDALTTQIAADKRCEIKSGALLPTAVHPGGRQVAAAITPIAFGHLFGWLLSIAAVSLGAPFWFDTLSRFVNVRGAGPAERPKNKGDNTNTNEERRG